MKFKILLVATIALIFSGCALTQGKTYQIQLPHQDQTTNKFDVLNLPQSVQMQGQIFTLVKTGNAVEYYKSGERGYGWSELISVIYDPAIKDINIYEKALHHTHQVENSLNPRFYKIEKLDEKSRLTKVLYMPMTGSAEFDNYEANWSLATTQKCGVVVVIYAKKFDKNHDKKSLLTMLEKEQVDFIKNAPNIECK